MLTYLREIVEKVAVASNLPEALELLVNQTCQAMATEVCSLYLADNDQRCYYLMATRGLKKPPGQIITLAFEQGIVGLIGRTAEPINLADAHSHPDFKYIPQVREAPFRSFLGVPIIHRRQLLGVLVVQQRQPRQFDKSEESFLVTLATQLASILAASQRNTLFSHYRQTRIRALAASPGVAVALGWQDSNQPSLEQVYQASALDISSERERLERALEEARVLFRRLSQRFTASAQKESAAIFDLYCHLLNDRRLTQALFAEIDARSTAEWAVKQVVDAFASQFAKLQHAYLRERAQDLRALGQRLLFHLDEYSPGTTVWPQRFILLAEELTATQLAELPVERLAGVVVRDGATYSHAAILARAMGIPTIMGVDIQPTLLANRMLVVDGYRGELLVNPEPLLIEEYQRVLIQEQELSQRAEAEVTQVAQLKSGERLQIMLNAGLCAEHEQRLGEQVDGVGLYRTEMLFMLQSGFPSEEEQTADYRTILQRYSPKPVTLRTLDIGADKQLPYLPLSEENPSLGWRGMRITLDQPDLLLIQVRAMLRANAESGNLQILLPMITSLDEIDAAKRLISRATREVAVLLGRDIPQPKIGIMLEVPSLLFLLAHVATRVDFISVGTNDLTQYLLAVDRNNTRVAALYDGLHPAMLQVLRQVILQGSALNLPVSLCGELAGDPMGALLLVGLGYRHLSINGYQVARIKYLLHHITLTEAANLAERALTAQTTDEIRRFMAAFIERRGMGGLIRGGH
ncbi:phosphoenolpyruvate--protein phosphotransferase [Serratia microhaemolytica]|uniref:phosphoenolpyruvate--protein phosphotransferase n=1 Tax=Serratia microhaemolytica TaxID=2675110 RepID=UPI000FDF1DF5|nr:phosphoenolpyruvate--protein phosphotransferase [Serratia microhaemolytica]